jgi:hypothetical protein
MNTILKSIIKYISQIKNLFHLISLLIIVNSVSSCNITEKLDLKLNDIQIVGSHNSYKKTIDVELMQILYAEDSNLALTLEYAHLTIPEQLNMGMRNLELDLFHDPVGGRYSKPLGLKAIENPSSYDTSIMNVPGFKVFHVQDIDFRSHYYLFSEALEVIRNWSDDNPDHVPLIITINLKDEMIAREGFTNPLPYNKNALDSVDKEILSVLNWDRLIYPDLVRGSYITLEGAILEKGWPYLHEVSGKMMFVLDASYSKNDLYMEGHPSLSNRVMFVNVEEGQPEAAFRILNNPFISFKKIQELVQKGYLVRTRADANTIEARMNDYSRWERAKKSGAQVISTDYYMPSMLFESEYVVGFGGDTVFRTNTIRMTK